MSGSPGMARTRMLAPAVTLTWTKAAGGTLAATWPVHVHVVALVNVPLKTGPPSPNCTLTHWLMIGPRLGERWMKMLPVTWNWRGTTVLAAGELTLTEIVDMRAAPNQCVNAAKSVDTASSLVLKARQSAGTYCASSPSVSASTARNRARSSVSSSTWLSVSAIQSSPGTGGTASSTHWGAQASGGSNWNVTAVVSRVFGTVSVHSSTSNPVSGCAVLMTASVCSTSDSLPAASDLPGSGGSPTQRSPLTSGSCATLRFSRSPVTRTSAPRRHAFMRPIGSRMRAY